MKDMLEIYSENVFPNQPIVPSMIANWPKK